MTDETTTTRRRVLAGTATAAAATVPVVGTTAAESNGTQGILADGVGDSDDAIAFLDGWYESFRGGFDPFEEAVTLADRMRNEFNANRDRWLSYGSWLLDEHDVSPIGDATLRVDVAITRSLREPLRETETVTTTITTEFDESTGAYTELDWIDGTTDADPTYQVTVKDYAAQQAANELQTFRRRYIGDSRDGHELPEAEYLSRLAGRHASDIGLGEESKHVLELLLGDS